MPEDTHQDPQRAVRDRIVRLMRANKQARRKPLSEEERQKLQNAASRLDQLLQTSEDAGRQELARAAGRLEQLLADIRTGKDVTLKRRPGRPEKT